MNRLDVYYRALCAYRKETAVRHCESFRRAVAEANTENDELTVSKNICAVDSDWMDAIEAGLVFVEKAIKQERQFIHSNGEVMPIEKIKQVSKESVQHLARHSNLITKQRDDGEMIPDHLYSVEKLNDFAVYENRFLYMLLCYLRDFITIRYEKILDLSTRYDGHLQLKKDFVFQNQKLEYSVELHDERKNDALLRDTNPAKASIDRMDLMLKAVLALLSTPLMEIAGKAPKLKPPITKTNILKMDNSFKGAMALYEYVVSYDRPGYTVEQEQTRLTPFSDALADELSEAGGMLQFLMYEYGLNLNDTLKKRMAEAEQREREEQIIRKERKIAQLKKKLENREITPEEYILELESHIRLLETDNRRIPGMKARIEELGKQNERAQAQILELTDQKKAAEDSIEELKIVHARERASMQADYEDRIYQTITSGENAKNLLREACGKKIRQAEESLNAERAVFEQRLLDMDSIHEKEMQSLKDSVRDGEQACERLTKERDEIAEQKLVCEARIKALRAASGESFGETEFTEREDFNELERELEAFVRFYDERWGIAKKSIRKKLLNYQSLKGKNGKNDSGEG